MDLVDIISEKKFIGQEFLTWLWWKSEERGGSISLPEQGDIIVVFEKHMLLEYGEGQSNEKLICRGLQTELKEARTGISIGKKLEQARIRIEENELEWSFTLAAGLMEFRNVKLPKTAALDENIEDKEKESEGLILERIFLFEELIRIVNGLFKLFLDVRLGSYWQQEIQKIKGWVGRSEAEV